MSKFIYLYTGWVRLWHLLNALLCILLIITGISLQYSGPDRSLIRFDISVSMHNISAILLTASYFLFLFINIFTSNGKNYRLKWKGLFKDVMIQVKYYSFGIFKGHKVPFPVSKDRKFNPLQKVSYILIMFVLMPLMFITGWALLFPEVIAPQVFGWSGLHLTDLLHIFSGYVISVFMFIHIYFCTLGVTFASNFRCMITGWYESHD